MRVTLAGADEMLAKTSPRRPAVRLPARSDLKGWVPAPDVGDDRGGEKPTEANGRINCPPLAPRFTTVAAAALLYDTGLRRWALLARVEARCLVAQ
jgi:hypothetical protein